MASRLRGIDTRPSTASDVQDALKELHTDGPRGAAALGAALIEDLLRGCLLINMRQLTKGQEDQLFVGQGPLASFSSRAKMSHALQVFGNKTLHDIDAVREIRNTIVHAQRRIGFDHTAVASLISGMHCVQFIVDAQDLPAQARFAHAIERLVLHLAGYLTSFEDPSCPRPIVGLD